MHLSEIKAAVMRLICCMNNSFSQSVRGMKELCLIPKASLLCAGQSIDDLRIQLLVFFSWETMMVNISE